MLSACHGPTTTLKGCQLLHGFTLGLEIPDSTFLKQHNTVEGGKKQKVSPLLTNPSTEVSLSHLIGLIPQLIGWAESTRDTTCAPRVYSLKGTGPILQSVRGYLDRGPGGLRDCLAVFQFVNFGLNFITIEGKSYKFALMDLDTLST